MKAISNLMRPAPEQVSQRDRKSTRLNSSHQIISYAVFCLKKKNPPDHILMVELEADGRREPEKEPPCDMSHEVLVWLARTALMGRRVLLPRLTRDIALTLH